MRKINLDELDLEWDDSHIKIYTQAEKVWGGTLPREFYVVTNDHGNVVEVKKHC